MYSGVLLAPERITMLDGYTDRLLKRKPRPAYKPLTRFSKYSQSKDVYAKCPSKTVRKGFVKVGDCPLTNNQADLIPSGQQLL